MVIDTRANGMTTKRMVSLTDVRIESGFYLICSTEKCCLKNYFCCSTFYEISFKLNVQLSLCICCSYFFVSGNACFSFVFGYSNEVETKEKQKLPEIKKLTTTYIFGFDFKV